MNLTSSNILKVYCTKHLQMYLLKIKRYSKNRSKKIIFNSNILKSKKTIKL
jgi:hypothetical protein